MEKEHIAAASLKYADALLAALGNDKKEGV